MANQNETKNSIIRQIALDFFNTIPFYYNDGLEEKQISSVEEFRKIISDGGISTAVGQQNQIGLYRQDYQIQTPPSNFDFVIDELTKCWCDGDVVIDENGGFGHTCPTGYDSVDNFSIDYHVGDGTLGNGYESFRPNVTDISCPAGEIDIPINDNILSILSQYIPFDYTQINIDPTQAEQVLDTNIFELLPQVSERQEQINKFFSDYQNLKGNYPQSPWPDTNNDGILDGTPEQPPIARDSDNISSGGQSIDRIIDYSTGVNLENNQSLEWLRDDLNEFLKDVDQQDVDELDDRPIYENKSDGYLKIRHMNQAIIVRKEEGIDIGVQDSYLTDGFTITMWVKFLDKVNSGTLFNFGNPLRTDNPMGFMLETFVVNKEDGVWTNAPDDKFLQGDTERFIRLVVREEYEGEPSDIRDSHFGIGGQPRLKTIIAGGDTSELPALENNIEYAFNHTRVPIDLNEWYFIVANYDPIGIDEDNSIFDDNSLDQLPAYWQWNYDSDSSSYVENSGKGSRCKVEIISKSDLIRARGFRINN